MGSLLTPVSSLREHTGAKILVVEDEFIVARDIQRRLEILGYVVVGCVATGEDAVERSEKLQPDLALIDISLRGKMDGIEAARRIREIGDIAVVFATANSDVETFDRAREAAPSGFVLKPFDEREVGIIIDAALYKHATARALRESEHRYNQLFESVREGLFLTTESILECNQQFCAMLALAKSDIIGRSLADLSPIRQPDGGDSAEKLNNVKQRAIQGAPQTFPWHLRRGENGTIPGTINLQPMRIAGRTILQGVLQPGEDTPRSEYARGELAAIVESSADAIFSKSLEGVIMSWNAGAERLYGYRADEIVGRPVTILLRPQDQDEVQNILDRLKAGEHVDHFEGVRIRKDGREVHVSVTISPIKDSSGTIVAASTIARDISEWRRAMDDTKTALREKELLLHEIHHRTKNNLQIVSSLLSLQAKTSTNQDVKLLVRQSQDRLNAMAMIHARLAQSHDATRVDFSEYLNGLVGDLARSYATGDVQIRVEADRTELDAEIAMSCGLIINELVTNACKYAFPDGRSGEVVVRFHSPGDGRHELIVTDNGVGMKKDAGGQRSHSLGFQLVETLVEQIGGRMEVSTEGGSSFLIQFTH